MYPCMPLEAETVDPHSSITDVPINNAISSSYSYVWRPLIGLACRNCFRSNNPYSLEALNVSPKMHLDDILTLPHQARYRSRFRNCFSDISYSFDRKSGLFSYSDVTDDVLQSPRLEYGISRAIAQQLEHDAVKRGCTPLQATAEAAPVKRGCTPLQTPFEVAASAGPSAVVDPEAGGRVKSQEKIVLGLIAQMRARISASFIRFTGWALHKLLRRLFRTIQVHRGQLTLLQNASKNNLPIIYLPNHRSHLDYILLTFILWNYDIRAPHVAAGINLLSIPGFSLIMRKLGGFFIRRRLDFPDGRRDFVYRATLHSYMSELMKRGECMEFFIEAGRSRTGKTILPKAGLLSIIVESYLKGDITNAYLVPVSISYEKLVEGSFSSELMGQTKTPETFIHVMKSIWTALTSNYGSVRVDFAQPVLLNDLLDSLLEKSQSNNQSKSTPDSPRNCFTPSFSALNMSDSITASPMGINDRGGSGSMLGNMQISADDQRFSVSVLSRHVAYDIENNKSIMCTNLVCFLLLNKYREGAALKDICWDLEWLIGEIRDRDRDVGFTGKLPNVVLYAANLIGEKRILLEECTDSDSGCGSDMPLPSSSETVANTDSIVLKPNIGSISQALDLAYYSNACVSVFLCDSIIALALFACLDKKVDGALVSYDELLEKAILLTEILQFDFIVCKPCESSQSRFDRVIDDFVEKKYFVTSQLPEASASHDVIFTAPTDDQEECIESPLKLREPRNQKLFMVNVNTSTLAVLKFYVQLLRPVLVTYFETARCVHEVCSLLPMKEKDFILAVEAKMIARFSLNELKFAESANVESIKHALKWLITRDVISSCAPDQVCLSPTAESDHFFVSNIVSVIEQFLTS